MREFIYYSKTAVTSGSFIKNNLMKAGRMDIVCNVIISTFFISHQTREDITLHLIFDGPPNPPAHLVLQSHPDMLISKKDIAGLLKRMLYKSPNKEGLKEIFPGCSIEKNSFEKLIKQLDNQDKNIFLLDKKATDIRATKLTGNEVFIIGDHDGFPHEKKKFLRNIDKVSVGPQTYFTSQVITILHNEIDRQVDSSSQ